MPMKSRRIIIAVLSIVVGLLGNIVATQLWESFDNYLKLVWVPFVILGVVLIALDVWEKRPERSEGRTDELASRNRSAMLEKVRAIWINGVLNKSLYQETLARWIG